VLFTSSTSGTAYDGANIEVVSLADHRRKNAPTRSTFGRYLPASNGTGHLVYINKGTLFAVPFDPERLEVRGTPSPVLEEVAYSTLNGSAQFDFSRNGTLVYTAEAGRRIRQFWSPCSGWMPLARRSRCWRNRAVYQRPHVSPDASAWQLDDGRTSGYEPGRTMTRLTFGGGANIAPVWSPDGRLHRVQWTWRMWWVRPPTGRANPQPLTQGKNALVSILFHARWKAAGLQRTESGHAYDLGTVTIESDGGRGCAPESPRSSCKLRPDERHPTFLLNGRWLAYVF